MYSCGFEHLNTLDTHMLCVFYFITDGNQNSMFCSLGSIPRQDYEQSYRLKEQSLIGLPSLRTAVYQTCPSNQIQDWYGQRSVATDIFYRNTDEH